MLSVRQQWSFLPCLHRRFSGLSQPEKDNINSWIKSHPLPKKQPPLLDYISSARIEALRCTLSTLDGSIPNPQHRLFDTFTNQGSHISPGHHLVFCNPAVPERYLNADATSSPLLPPAPLTRRMWSGGRFEFRKPISVGDGIIAESSVSKIEAKRLHSERPMLVVEQSIELKVLENETWNPGANALGPLCITEMRSHVYLPVNSEHHVRIVKDLPKPDFSLSYIPTDTMLFRFSALTFNAHRVHLYKEYAQTVEKLPERLVHGPMTALMLLEAIEQNRPKDSVVRTFEYKATNPLFVNRPITIHGSWLSRNEVKVWAQSDDGIVGMVGVADLTEFVSK